MILCARSRRRIFGQAGTLHFFHFFQKRHIDTFCVVDPACGIGTGNRPGSQLLRFLDRVNRYITGTGYGNRLPCNILTVAFQHLFCQIKQSIAGRLCPCKRTAVCKPLTGQHAFILIANPLILSVHIADLTTSHTDITCRYIGICSNMSVKLCHETLAERHHLSVRFSLGIKIAAALTAADRQSCQRILKDLLKPQELNNTKINGRMESQTSLIGTDRTVKLHTESIVHLYLSLVIHPGNTKLYNSLRNCQALQQSFFSVCFFV